MLYIAQRWLILTWSVQNIKNMCKLKGILLTNEILRDLRLRWVSDGYPPTLDSPAPLEPDFSAIPCHASQTWSDWDSVCSWSVFPIITAVEYEVLHNFWDTSMVNITYINITYINDCTVTYIHALTVRAWIYVTVQSLIESNVCYIHPWALVVFHVQLHQLIRYLPKHNWSFYRWKFNPTSVMRF